MFSIARERHTHSDRLDRWLGAGQTEVYSAMFRDWYGPPVALAGVPGAVYVAKGGDFVGPIRGGGFANLIDFAEQRTRRIWRQWLARQRRTANAGFSSLSDLISEATAGGKGQLRPFLKAATTATTAGNAFSCFNVGTLPAAGASAARLAPAARRRAPRLARSARTMRPAATNCTSRPGRHRRRHSPR